MPESETPERQSAERESAPVVRIGTRGSKLALAQSGIVARDIERLLNVKCELVVIRTDGDVLTGSLASLGGQGVFVAALRQALLEGRVDIAVHSLKDLPTVPAPELVVAAIPRREDPRDALCVQGSQTLLTLAPGASVGTGSPRRVSQLLAARPDLRPVDIRGNVDSRLARVHALADAAGELDAVILAAAGLARVGLADQISERLDPAVMLPAPGQGALALETRADSQLVESLKIYDDVPTRLAVSAERAVLSTLGAGCATPVGALGELVGHQFHLEAVAAAPNGSATLREGVSVEIADEASGLEQAIQTGVVVAQALLARGAAKLMEDTDADLPAEVKAERSVD